MDVAEVRVCAREPEERGFGELNEKVERGYTVAHVSTVCVCVCVCILTFSCVILDYKNNLLKEKVHMNTQPKVIDLDKGNKRSCKVNCDGLAHIFLLLTLNLSLFLCRDAEIF